VTELVHARQGTRADVAASMAVVAFFRTRRLTLSGRAPGRGTVPRFRLALGGARVMRFRFGMCMFPCRSSMGHGTVALLREAHAADDKKNQGTDCDCGRSDTPLPKSTATQSKTGKQHICMNLAGYLWKTKCMLSGKFVRNHGAGLPSNNCKHCDTGREPGHQGEQQGFERLP
jgi:hypothetical protein